VNCDVESFKTLHQHHVYGVFRVVWSLRS